MNNTRSTEMKERTSESVDIDNQTRLFGSAMSRMGQNTRQQA